MSLKYNNDYLLFIGFYIVSSLLYYTASWISWGAFQGGHPGYFTIEEYFASGGAQFIISFIITIVIWYITSILMKSLSLKTRLLSHIIFLPLYVVICYYLLFWTTHIFGWAMYWGGYKVVWTLYNFVLFYLLQFGLIHAYGYWKVSIKNQKEKAELKQLALQSEIIAMKSQLNPHFLHNLFNSIVASVPVENENTRELIIKLSDLFRYQDYVSNQDEVTIAEEIDFIGKYLELMKVRLKDRLLYSIEVPEEILKKSIAPMLLQPLIENAVIHGISQKVNPSTLMIRMNLVDNKVHITIQDTGAGFEQTSKQTKKGKGISNTKLRLQKIYNSQLKIESIIDEGTKVSFEI